ncbi:MAG TPA: hypothetical protein VMT95_12760 [Candidatus Binatia bacterium]|nr:hypothetical protein [Candidatus Binatia bacterium]
MALSLVGFYLALQRSQYERQQAESNAKAQKDAEVAASSGFDFLVQGRSVAARLIPASTEIRRGDSLSITLRLDPGSSRSTAGLGNEYDGALTPTLSVGGCTVTPALASSKSTKAMLAAFVWQWSVDDCKSAGSKAVQVLLAFRPDRIDNGSDPVAYRGLQFVRFDDPFSWGQTLQVLGVVAGLFSAASALAAVFIRKVSGS